MALPVMRKLAQGGASGVSCSNSPVDHLWQLGSGARRSIVVVVMVGVPSFLLVLMLA